MSVKSRLNEFGELFNGISAANRDEIPGGVQNTMNTVVFTNDERAFNEENLHVPLDKLTVTPSDYVIDDDGVYVTFIGPDAKTHISMEYIEAANDLFDVDVLDNLDIVSIHEEYNYPAKIQPDDEEAFVVIAPRIMNE